MKKQKLATLFLMLGMFLNPLGFDAIQMTLMKLVGSYSGANLVLYSLALLCFGFYFLFSGSNPIKEIRNSIVYLIKKFK
jgi:hypothetical protein